MSGALSRAVPGVLLAMAAAAAYGGSSVLQFRANRQVPPKPAARPTLLALLVRRPGWRWSAVLALVAFGLQFAALALLPLIVVQPLLVTGLLWYVLLFAVAQRLRPDRTSLVYSALCLVGLAAFLVIARPVGNQGRQFDRAGPALVLGGAVAVTVVLCLLLAVRLGARWRPLPLAFAAAVCYAMTAGLVSALVPRLTEPVALPHQWQIYAIAVLGPFGVLLSQNAYQAGPMGAPALAVITVGDPVVSIAIGLLWLDERVRTGPWPVLGELCSLALLVAAVWLLARRAPHVRGG